MIMSFRSYKCNTLIFISNKLWDILGHQILIHICTVKYIINYNIYIYILYN